MAMRSLVVYLAFTTIALCSPALSNPQLIGEDPTLEELFRYSDLVVEGIVERITTVVAPAEDYAPGAPGPSMPFAIILFRVNRVLLGYTQKEHIEIVAMKWESPGQYCFDLQKGDRYIMSLLYSNKGRLFEQGRFFTRLNAERFLVKDLKWFQGRKDQPVAEGDLQELYALVEQAAIERSYSVLTRRADLIIRGKVVATTWTRDSRSDGEESGIQRVTLTIQSIIKGDAKGDSLVLSLLTKYGTRKLPWGVLVPPMHVGEEWIAFLKHADDPGYYPFAGVNGLFMVKGDSLIRNNWNEMETGYSARQMELDLIRMAAQGE